MIITIIIIIIIIIITDGLKPGFDKNEF